MLCEAQSQRRGCVLRSVDIYISINNLYLFYESRASKTERGEGGLLCVRN